MAKKHRNRIRVSEHDALRLGMLLRHREATLSEGVPATVVEVTKGGIQVRNHTTGHVMPFPLFDAIANGKVKINDPELEYKAKRILKAYQVAEAPAKRSAPETPPATAVVDTSRADVPQDEEVRESPKPEDTGGRDIDVASNVALSCFFNNVTEEACNAHLDNLGFDGFSMSLEAGFEGRHRYLALRECANHLGCGFDALLATPCESLTRILRTCGHAPWKLTGREAHIVRDRPEDDIPTSRRTLTFESATMGTRRITIDERRRDTSGAHHTMSCTLSMWTPPIYAFSERTLNVDNPDAESIRLFVAFFAPSEASDEETAHLGPATSGNAKPATAPAAKPEQKKGGKKAKAEQPKARPIHVNEFLVRRTFGSHRTNGHSQQPIRAVVSILPKSGGDPRPMEFDAYWCPKYNKYFMDERTYLRLRQAGYICCKVIEENALQAKWTGTSAYDRLPSESIVHTFGYNVNQQKNLSAAERRMILSFVIENRLQSTQEVAHLLEWLISQRKSMPNMASAVKRWREDLDFVRHYHPPVRRVRVDAIFAKV